MFNESILYVDILDPVHVGGLPRVRAASVQKQSGGVNRTCADQKPFMETQVRPKQVIMLST